MTIAALSVIATGMVADQRLVQTIANNISNSTNVGFHKDKLVFSDLAYQTEGMMGALAANDGSIVPVGVQYGLGVSVGGAYKIFSQGNLVTTPNVPLNIAIQGSGFLVVNMPDGSMAYTRAGELTTNQDGMIVTVQGYEVSPGITIPQGAQDLTITTDGTVEVIMPGQTQPQNIGQFDMATFNNPSGLQAIGNDLYVETAASGTAVTGHAMDSGFGQIKQFWLEESNVEAINEMMDLIEAQRNYEMGAKIMKVVERMEENIIEIK